VSSTQYFVALRIDLPYPRDPRSESYGDDAADFYEAVSELLGAGSFDSPMTLEEDHVGTYLYIPADVPGEAATSAIQLLSETAKGGAGARVSAERVIMAAERDLELAAEGIE
jgi:hypothetical protein